jgi:hypothetical protein
VDDVGQACAVGERLLGGAGQFHAGFHWSLMPVQETLSVS